MSAPRLSRPTVWQSSARFALGAETITLSGAFIVHEAADTAIAVPVQYDEELIMLISDGYHVSLTPLRTLSSHSPRPLTYCTAKRFYHHCWADE